jgi:transcriptional regulator
MYTPKINQETDLITLQDFIMAYNFAILVNQNDGELNATHLPLILDKERGEYGTLIGHMARANKQWKAFDEQEVMIIFNGPHAYISPTWYVEHPSVPTWNYSTVHAYGIPRLTEGQQATDDALRLLVEHQEKDRNPKWVMDLPDDYLNKLRKAIVTFEIPITRLEGKFKLSQNKSDTDKQNVISELLKSEYGGDVAMGGMMQGRLTQG